MRTLTVLSLMAMTGAATAVPMPDPAGLAGLQVVEIDVPDEAVVDLLLESGLDGLACRPAPGLSPWVVSEDDLSLIESLGLDHHALIADLESHQAAQNAARQAARLSARGLDPFYADFRTYDEYMARIDQFLIDHADIATGINIGQSHEGRDIRGVVINVDGTEKPACLFNGCQHAREWISPPTTWYIADTLADQYGVDPQITALLDRVEVVVIPIINPDGYEHTYAPGGYRFWRKNRRVNGGSCDGVDLNRNWASDWNGGQSTSTDPCSDIYVGPASMSEPEVQALANYCTGHGDIRAQIDFHAFSQLILEPRGYTTVPPPDWDELHALGGEMSDAIQSVNGLTYVHDNPCNILYCASGTLIDWPYDTYGAAAYCIELRPGAGGIDGFDPPPSEIIPCAEENFQAALTLINHVGSPLSISLPGGSPSMVSTTEPTTFDVDITPGAENPDVSTATLHHRGGPGGFMQTPLINNAGDMYTATLPTFTCDEMPEFYVSVQSLSGLDVVYPAGAPVELLSAMVVSDLDVVFDDDGETDAGWSVSGNATDGQWDRGVPANGQRGDPPADADGSGQCWLTDNVAGNSDVDGGQTILTSPTFDVPGDGWQLSYWRWFSNDAGSAPSEDIFTVQWSQAGTGVWQDLEVDGPLGASGGWELAEFELDEIDLAGVDAFQLRFIAEDAGSGSVVEAAIDGVLVAKIDCTDEDPCAGDMNESGAVDVDDILIVIGSYGSNDPAGDVDGDGFVGVDDVLAVVAAFGPC